MSNKLKKYFPMIQEKEKLLITINQTPHLLKTFNSWEEKRREEFVDFCTGARGIKVLYDSFFKEVMNPEYDPSRLEWFISILLNRKVKIKGILPNEGVRIADENTLLITDIIVELEDGTHANIEIQKIGYGFPGQRSACYSSDMLLRQYKRVRDRTRKDKSFSYHQIKNVYLIVIYESSPGEFHKMPDQYIHRARQVFDTQLQLDLLQEYIMIPLDIFKESMENKTMETPLEAWLTFLSSDDPDRIIELIEKFPEFRAMYETLYNMCLEVNKTMGYFSEELRIMDQNMVTLMIEEQQKEIEEQQKEIEDLQKEIEEQQKENKAQQKELDMRQETIDQQQKEIEILRKRILELDNNKNM